ncbi:MAG TPA: hypothetical protein VLA88_03845 [Candidatus Saccharimonadales bacterium]|nr:hypothetical protein [Candidatus Saccharimonadales bacterium]
MQPARTLIDNNTLRTHASTQDMQQGQEYFSQNQARATHIEDARIDGQIADPTLQQTYNTVLASSAFGLSWQCTCGSTGSTSGGSRMCSHVVATALAAQH